MATDITNPGFETGNLTGWQAVPVAGPPEYKLNADVLSNPQFVMSGSYSCQIAGGDPFIRGWLQQADLKDVYEGQQIEVLIYMIADPRDVVGWIARWEFDWYDENEVYLSTSQGTRYDSRSTWQGMRDTFTVPANAAYVRPKIWINKNGSLGAQGLYFDDASWDNNPNATATLTSPADGSSWDVNQTVPLAISVSSDEPPVTSVVYKADNVTIRTANSAPFSSAHAFDSEGEYDITADVSFANGSSQTVGPHTITVESGGGEGEGKEYKASNAYTYLITENFSGLTAAMPGTAQVTGIEMLVDYKLEALVRSKNLDSDDLSIVGPDVLFDSTNGGTIELAFLAKEDGSYEALGTTMLAEVPLARSDFEVVETGTSEGKRWTVLSAVDLPTVTVGGEESLFGLGPFSAFDFLNRAIGIRYYPNATEKASYADSGDAVVRFFLDQLRLRVYFDAGSADYYFTDGTNVIKGTLAAYCISGGNFATGDAYGELQLTPDLEIMDGSANAIGSGWTIHTAYPPNDDNKIGTVTVDSDGMIYNGLPTQRDIINNRSRYEIISTNFYGDAKMNSFYGVHGLPRAFAYNPDFFYKICAHPEPEKDQPRHIANHHEHLALGYKDGRVDLSVVGEPYNFDGALGASSWATADPVTGLLPLSGMILGIFGERSVTGLSGTTVDNFATQIISPKMGAIEYTIVDMGFPVYANHYGIYTLSQVQQYGDYMGTPLSQDVSPWLRPRLVRTGNKIEEVVAAWPVRAKNQYRLAFGDGYVMTMTINNGQQGAPTFSTQKYFTQPPPAGNGWTPIADSSVGFTFDGATDVSMSGSIVSASALSVPEDQSWTINLDRPALVRLTVNDYNTYGLSEPAAVMFDGVDGEIINNDGQASFTWDPNPIESSAQASVITYLPAEYSDYPQDSYNILVEVYEEPTECEIRYDYESIVPIAISSELSDTGEERIHMAPIVEVEPQPEPEPPTPDAYTVLGNGCDLNSIWELTWYDLIDPDHGPQNEVDPPSWWVHGDAFTVSWQDWEGEYQYDEVDNVYYLVAQNGGTAPECCGPEGQNLPYPVMVQGPNSAYAYLGWWCG